MVIIVFINIKRIQTVQWKLNNEMAFFISQMEILSLYVIIKKLPTKGGIKEQTIKLRFFFFNSRSISFQMGI